MTITKDESGITVCGTEFFNARDTLECGQTFRFFSDGDAFVVRSADKVCRVRQADDVVRIDTDDPGYFYSYFALDEDYAAYYSALHAFPELDAASEAGKGIRLLRQDPFEMIISFIISAKASMLPATCSASPLATSLADLSSRAYMHCSTVSRSPSVTAIWLAPGSRLCVAS